MEEWRDVKGYEGFYQVSDKGNVRSLAVFSYKYQRVIKRKQPRLLQLDTTYDGYKRVVLSLYGSKKRYSVHRLVAFAFIPNPNNFPEVNHKDEDSANNVASNLEWCTAKYNSNYGTLRRRMSEWSKNNPSISKAVLQYSMDGTFIGSYPSAKEAQRQTGANADVICRVCKGKSSHSGGFKWVYANK